MKLALNDDCSKIRITELEDANIVDGNLEGSVSINCCNETVEFSKAVHTATVNGCSEECMYTFCVDLFHNTEAVEALRDVTCVGADCNTPSVCCSTPPYDTFTQSDVDNLNCNTSSPCTPDTEMVIASITFADSTGAIVTKDFKENSFTSCNDFNGSKIQDIIYVNIAKTLEPLYGGLTIYATTNSSGQCIMCISSPNPDILNFRPVSITMVATGVNPALGVYSDIPFRYSNPCDADMDGVNERESVVESYVDLTPEDISQTGESFIDGIYTITSGEDSNCVPVLCEHKCKVLDKMAEYYDGGETEKALSLYMNYEALVNGANCDCSCNKLCVIYENMLKSLGEISQNPNTNC
jgi:hypothetical protein